MKDVVGCDDWGMADVGMVVMVTVMVLVSGRMRMPLYAEWCGEKYPTIPQVVDRTTGLDEDGTGGWRS